MRLQATTVSVGDRFEAMLVEDLTRTQIVQYAGASGDFNPVHTDEVYATQVAGQRAVFAHGMLTMGMTGTILTDLVGNGRLLRYGARFQRQVWPGDSLRAVVTVVGLRHEDGAKVVDVTVTTENQRGETVLTGTASAIMAP